MKNTMFADCFLFFVIFVWNKFSIPSPSSHHIESHCIYMRLHSNLLFFSLFFRSTNRLLNFLRRFGRYTCDIYTDLLANCGRNKITLFSFASRLHTLSKYCRLGLDNAETKTKSNTMLCRYGIAGIIVNVFYGLTTQNRDSLLFADFMISVVCNGRDHNRWRPFLLWFTAHVPVDDKWIEWTVQTCSFVFAITVIECGVRAIELNNVSFLLLLSRVHITIWHTQIAGRIRTDNDRVAQYAVAACIRNGSFQE